MRPIHNKELVMPGFSPDKPDHDEERHLQWFD
jgi:hypothetical protein